MQKNIWQQLVAVIIFIWALWNYEITLSLLGSALGILMPLITGCVIAFTVNVFIEKFEQIWMRVLKDRAARFRGPVCLIAGFMLIFGVITALLFAVLPELHASIVILSHKLPQDIVYFNAFLQEQLLAWNFRQKTWHMCRTKFMNGRLPWKITGRPIKRLCFRRL